MARRKGATFELVREMALALPDVEATTSWGAPDFKVRGKMFACRAINKSAEPNTLCVRVDFAQRDELIAADPETYYVTDHYVDHKCVLVRLANIHADALRDLLLMGWQFMASSNRKPVRRRSRR